MFLFHLLHTSRYDVIVDDFHVGKQIKLHPLEGRFHRVTNGVGAFDGVSLRVDAQGKIIKAHIPTGAFGTQASPQRVGMGKSSRRVGRLRYG